jgi:hypothetical protein
MIDYTLEAPDREAISRQVAVFPALKKRRQHQSNIWFFDSPKNNKRFTITGDLAFMHLVCLEGAPRISGYVPAPGQVVAPINGQACPIQVGAQVYYCDGTLEWWDFKRLEHGARSKKARSASEPLANDVKRVAASAAGATYHVKTDRDLLGQEIWFDNWLTLCAAITRCRGQFLEREAEIFSQRMTLQHAVTLENLLGIPGIDVAHMLAVIAMALQRGTVRANLNSQLLSRMTLLSRIEP